MPRRKPPTIAKQSSSKRKSSSASADPEPKKIRLSTPPTSRSPNHADTAAAAAPTSASSLAATRPKRTSTSRANLIEKHVKEATTLLGESPRQDGWEGDKDAASDVSGSDTYTADFVMSYIDDPDEPTSATAAQAPNINPRARSNAKNQKEITGITRNKKPKHGKLHEITKGSARSQRADKGAVKFEAESNSPSTAVAPRSVDTDSAPIADTSAVMSVATPTEDESVSPHDIPAILDSEETVLAKISHAVHALGGLNIPIPSRPLISQDEINGM